MECKSRLACWLLSGPAITRIRRRRRSWGGCGILTPAFRLTTAYPAPPAITPKWLSPTRSLRLLVSMGSAAPGKLEDQAKSPTANPGLFPAISRCLKGPLGREKLLSITPPWPWLLLSARCFRATPYMTVTPKQEGDESGRPPGQVRIFRSGEVRSVPRWHELHPNDFYNPGIGRDKPNPDVGRYAVTHDADDA